MENRNIPNEPKDPRLWELAQKRASFKSNLVAYVIVNIFLWILWYMISGRKDHSGVPWPVWPTLGWGIGILFHYMGAYVTTGATSAEREYEKLKEKNK